jgi:hypothetical protein
VADILLKMNEIMSGIFKDKLKRLKERKNNRMAGYSG